MGLIVGYISYAVACLAYLGLALYYLWRGGWGSHGSYLLAASLLTAAWAGLSLFGHDIIPDYAEGAELLRHLAMLAWVWLLWHIVASLEPHQTHFRRRLLLGWVVIVGFTAAVLVALAADILTDWGSPRLSALLGLAIALLGLSLTETLYRSYQVVDRWGIKFLCIATGGLCSYDIFLYGDGLLFGALDPGFLEVRGLAQAMVVPCLVINIQRSEARHFSLGLSQRLVFGSTVILGAGLYLALMAAAAYYVRSIGGTWGSAVQTVFLFASLLLLIAFLLSGTFRSYVRHFLTEHLLKQKFDYRQEWRRLLQRISAGDLDEPLDLRVVKTLADLLDSPAGALWYLEGKNLALAATWNLPAFSLTGSEAATLIGLFHDREDVIDLRNCREAGAEAAAPPLPGTVASIEQARFLLPLHHHDKLMGLVLLAEPRVPRVLDREDRELVTMASRQAAGYLSEQRAARALAEAREFEKFNQRYAFVTHDVKNLVSQLSLIVRNFEKYGDRPDFQQDMLATVQSVVERMNNLMARLSGAPDTARIESVAIRPLIEALIGESSLANAAITLDCPPDLSDLRVRADTRRVDAILRHLFQNAIECCGGDGKIVVGLRQDQNAAVIEVRDSGKGMDLAFIRNELFRPFRSTKRGGMGIGAFQCRAYARELGGDLEAISSIGAGTTMRVTLPVLREA
jgi:putative PEP-CTERM system histidine kinase